MNGFEPRHDSEKIDLAFIVDCTSSMSPYIKQVQKHVQFIAETIARTSFDVRLSLIEYRDHPPQDLSFITRNHDFTSDVKEMKTWVDAMSASGGGDWPEAMADALKVATRLSYRQQATKMCVLIADAPPHGLDPNGDWFPNGCPNGHDPVDACHIMAQKGIVLYTIGCEPSVDLFRDFLVGLAYITGGQYVPLVEAKTLTKVIITASLEEMSLEKLMGHATDLIYLKLRSLKNKKEKSITIDDLAKDLNDKLTLTGSRSQGLKINDQPLDPVTPEGKRYGQMRTLSEAKAFYASNKKQRGLQAKKGKKDGEVAATEQATTKSQSTRLATKVVARSRLPVTHDENKNIIIFLDNVPDKI